jgi:hypothetical protein
LSAKVLAANCNPWRIELEGATVVVGVPPLLNGFRFAAGMF